jgi:hypothetical protein
VARSRSIATIALGFMHSAQGKGLDPVGEVPGPGDPREVEDALANHGLGVKTLNRSTRAACA